MVEGTQVGAYRVLQLIGQGGMGSVWLAQHEMLGRRAAIKVLHQQFSAQPEIVGRFFNEARAATAISDPGIVQIFDFGHHVDGSAYIVMELLEGEPLDRRLSRLGRLQPAEALRLMRQVATTLGAAHARGIVHRDLKPENIFIVRDAEVAGGERAKILDFGIAKLSGGTAPGGVQTQTSAVIGTPTYMSPEQCRGAGQVDQRSDVYSLGCLLFALLTGAPPFIAEGVGDVIAMHLREPPLAPSSRVPGLPREVDHLVLRCLAKQPLQRFAHAGELAQALGALGAIATGPQGQHAPSQPRLPVSTSTPTTLSSASGASLTDVPRRARWPFFALGGVVVSLAVIAIIVVTGGGTKEPAPAQVAATPPPPAPPPVSPPPKADPQAELAQRMKSVLDGFVAWSHAHAGAPCPDLAALGGDANDPWGHPMKLSCTDQPADQIAGVVSAGPDGAFGTADDVGSWELGRDVIANVRGARWVAAAPPPPAAKPAVAHVKPAKAPPAAPPPAPPPAKKPPSSQPIQLDENGIPISR